MKLVRITARVLALSLLLGIFFILGAQLAGIDKIALPASTKLSATPAGGRTSTADYHPSSCASVSSVITASATSTSSTTVVTDANRQQPALSPLRKDRAPSTFGSIPENGNQS